jgi:hypothetical protein
MLSLAVHVLWPVLLCAHCTALHCNVQNGGVLQHCNLNALSCFACGCGYMAMWPVWHCAQDFVFCKEVRLGSYSANAATLPPAAIVAAKAMAADPRAEPRYGERVPFVVSCITMNSPCMCEYVCARLSACTSLGPALIPAPAVCVPVFKPCLYKHWPVAARVCRQRDCGLSGCRQCMPQQGTALLC